MRCALEAIRAMQTRWALNRGVALDESGYVRDLNRNLFEELDMKAGCQFKRGAGRELNGHMRAPWSSSALVVNFFHYWRHPDKVDTIACVCGAPPGMNQLVFEAKHPTPLGSIPHLDVEFRGNDSKPRATPLAIESKFMEPYARRREPFGLDDKYVAHDGLWEGLPRCGRLARAIAKGGERFHRLDAPQLLKHVLGLRKSYGSGGFELLYLYYDFPSKESEEHKEEIGRFLACVSSELSLRTLCYQKLYRTLKDEAEGCADYLGYLEARYFPAFPS